MCPCDAVVINELELKAADPLLLTKAIEALGGEVNDRANVVSGKTKTILFRPRNGYSGWARVEGGKVQTPDVYNDFINRVRREYSAQVIEDTGRRLKWNTKRVAPNRLTAARRFR